MQFLLCAHPPHKSSSLFIMSYADYLEINEVVNIHVILKPFCLFVCTRQQLRRLPSTPIWTNFIWTEGSFGLRERCKKKEFFLFSPSVYGIFFWVTLYVDIKVLQPLVGGLFSRGWLANVQYMQGSEDKISEKICKKCDKNLCFHEDGWPMWKICREA